MGITEKIVVFSGKKAAGKELSEALLIENLGIEGDFNAAGGGRQVSLLRAETRELMLNEKGLCTSRFRENITVRGLDAAAIKPGVRFMAGGAILEISDDVKRCHRECGIHKEGKRCSLAGASLFARIFKSGVIRKGDPVIPLP